MTFPGWYTAVFVLWAGALVLAVGVYLKRDDPAWQRDMPRLQFIIAGQVLLGFMVGLVLVTAGSQ